jgi:hypothetical protein
MTDGTTANTHVTNTCTSAGERPNKTSNFISGVNIALHSWLVVGILL